MQENSQTVQVQVNGVNKGRHGGCAGFAGVYHDRTWLSVDLEALKGKP